MAQSFEQQFAIPNRITPNVPKEIINQPMTHHNDLRRVMLQNPEILPAVTKLFTENTGMLSEVLMYLQNSYNPLAESRKKTMGVSNKYDQMQKKFKIINNHEFAWRGVAPGGFVYSLVEDVVLDGDDTAGRGGKEFFMTLNKQLGDMDDVIMLADANTQVIITAPPVMSNGVMKVRVRLLQLRGATSRQAIPGYLLKKGRECKIIYNIKPEASEHGSRTRVAFGEWYRNWMGTQRWEWDITGHAAHMGIDPKAKTWLVWNNPYNGKMEPYWISVLHYCMLQKAHAQIDNQLFWGKPYIDPLTNQFRKDARGRNYYSGTGVYHQMSRRLKREYTKLNSFKIIDDMLRRMRYDTFENKRPTLLVVAGSTFQRQFEQLVRNEFSLSPQVLWFDGKGNFFGAPSGDQNLMGIRSNFNYYETSDGIFIVSGLNYFDRRDWPTLRTNAGLSEQSHRGLVFNISKNAGGMDAMTLVSLAGRQNVIGKVAGMSNPGPQGIITTPADVEGEHMLNMAGVAVHNPYAMGEFRLSRRRS